MPGREKTETRVLFGTTKMRRRGLVDGGVDGGGSRRRFTRRVGEGWRRSLVRIQLHGCARGPGEKKKSPGWEEASSSGGASDDCAAEPVGVVSEVEAGVVPGNAGSNCSAVRVCGYVYVYVCVRACRQTQYSTEQWKFSVQRWPHKLCWRKSVGRGRAGSICTACATTWR